MIFVLVIILPSLKMSLIYVRFKKSIFAFTLQLDKAAMIFSIIMQHCPNTRSAAFSFFFFKFIIIIILFLILNKNSYNISKSKISTCNYLIIKTKWFQSRIRPSGRRRSFHRKSFFLECTNFL